MNRKQLVEKGLKEFMIDENFKELFIWICEEFNKVNLKLATNDELKEECKKRKISIVPDGCGIYSFGY